MKIIGETGDGYIVEMDDETMAKILGYGSVRDVNYHNSTPRVGSEFDILEISSVSNYLRGIDSGSITAAKRSLESVITALDTATVVVGKLNLFEKLKK